MGIEGEGGYRRGGWVWRGRVGIEGEGGYGR